FRVSRLRVTLAKFSVRRSRAFGCLGRQSRCGGFLTYSTRPNTFTAVLRAARHLQHNRLCVSTAKEQRARSGRFGISKRSVRRRAVRRAARPFWGSNLVI